MVSENKFIKKQLKTRNKHYDCCSGEGGSYNKKIKNNP